MPRPTRSVYVVVMPTRSTEQICNHSLPAQFGISISRFITVLDALAISMYISVHGGAHHGLFLPMADDHGLKKKAACNMLRLASILLELSSLRMCMEAFLLKRAARNACGLTFLKEGHVYTGTVTIPMRSAHSDVKSCVFENLL